MSWTNPCVMSPKGRKLSTPVRLISLFSLMNVRPMGPALARGGKLTLARCVWYPGPGLMEKACFHSCQSHLLRTTPRLHTHGEDHRLPISHTPYPSAPRRQFVFVILWTRSGGNYEQNNTNNARLCARIAPRRCFWILSGATVAEFGESRFLWCIVRWRVKKLYNLLHIRLRSQRHIILFSIECVCWESGGGVVVWRCQLVRRGEV